MEGKISRDNFAVLHITEDCSQYIYDMQKFAVDVREFFLVLQIISEKNLALFLLIKKPRSLRMLLVIWWETKFLSRYD